MKLLYATTNKSKIEYMQKILEGLEIEILSPSSPLILPEVKEDGREPIENACIKARAYYEVLREPLFSCDSGLLIDGLNKDRQPGARVRRVGNRELDDSEMIAYYSKLVKELGGYVKASYRNAICLILNPKRVLAYDGDDLAEQFILVDRPHELRKLGFPLDSLSVEIGSGEYFVELYENGRINSSGCESGFRRFFSDLLSKFASKSRF